MNHDGKIGKTADQQSQDLTGTSIVAGHFFQLNEYHYAISSPNVDDNHGKVFLLHTFEKKDSKSIALDGRHALCGGRSNENEQNNDNNCHQNGARFGASMVAVDLNGDNYDDLIVGAPLFSDIEVGCNTFKDQLF